MEPFRIDIPQSDLDDLRERLHRTRWPEAETVDDWSQGIPLGYVRELCTTWERDYDWRAVEAELNSYDQVKVQIDGLGIHALHVRSPRADAVPLLLTHGWPGSVVEFLDVLRPLTDPPADQPAFHVVAPSLPGYGFSDKPTSPGWTAEKIAGAWAELMARLGYDRYAAAGGDWGAIVTSMIPQADPEHLLAVHVTMPLTAPGDTEALDPEDQRRLATLMRFRKEGSGYSAIQSTRPQTLGYGLVDSPVAQCSWIVEKFQAWTDCDGHPENAISRTRLLDNVSVYWLTGTAASSARLYWESFRTRSFPPVPVPTAVTLFPAEPLRTPRAWVEQRYTDLRSWREPARGGHFGSLEQPELFVEALRSPEWLAPFER